jgi:hypothetical protein
MELSWNLSALGPAVITGLVALATVYLTNRGTSNRLLSQLSYETLRARNDMLRTKGEAIFELVAAWGQNFAAQCVAIQSVMKGQISYNDALDIQANEVKRIDHDRMQMMISAYFPVLQKELDRVLALRSAVTTLQTLHRENYRRGETDGSALLRPYTEANLELAKSIESLKQSTVLQIRAIK